MDSTAELARCVRTAWLETLPAVPFDPDLSWREAGLNSLKALELALRLERTLGRKLSFDGLTPDCTTNDWLRLLSRTAEAARPQHDRRPQVFFVTGLEGDNPYQASFRHAMRREVRFETLDAGNIDASARELSDIPARAARLVQRVLEQQPQGAIRLAGCSFGALVAQEMTSQLEARGTAVSFLALLDGFLAPPLWRPLDGTRPPRAAALIARRERFKRLLMRGVGPVLRQTGVLELVRRIVRTGPFRDRRWARAGMLRVLRASGFLALGSWRGKPCRAPALLVATADFAAFSSLERWQELCPTLEVVRVPGRHVQMFDAVAMERIVPAFLQALAHCATRPGGSAEAA